MAASKAVRDESIWFGSRFTEVLNPASRSITLPYLAADQSVPSRTLPLLDAFFVTQKAFEVGTTPQAGSFLLFCPFMVVAEIYSSR